MADAVPLFHQVHGLSPMVEVALTQVESVARQEGLRVAGYYHANELLRDSAVDPFSQKIADKVHMNNRQTMILTIFVQNLCLLRVFFTELLKLGRLLGLAKLRLPGFMNFAPALAHLFCPNLPVTFLQPVVI